MSKKKPPVALKKLAFFLNNVHNQLEGKMEVVICTLYGEGNGSLSIYFANQSVATHAIICSSHSIQFQMEYIQTITSISNSHLNMYAGILNMYQSELRGVVQKVHVPEMDMHSGIFKMPFEVRMFH